MSLAFSRYCEDRQAHGSPQQQQNSTTQNVSTGANCVVNCSLSGIQNAHRNRTYYGLKRCSCAHGYRSSGRTVARWPVLILWSEVASGQPKRYVRSMSDEEEKMSLEIWCDLLEAELKRALEDLSVIRGLDKAQAKSKSHMLRAALNNAQHYFREIQDSLR